jgi:hypothetical protein
MWIFLIDEVIQGEGLHVYNMWNFAEKHFSISIAPVRSWGGSLVLDIIRRGYSFGIFPIDMSCRKSWPPNVYARRAIMRVKQLLLRSIIGK